MSSPAPKPAVATALFDTLDQIHLVAIHPNGLKIVGRDFAGDLAAATEFAALQNADGLNVYWTVNAVKPGHHSKPSKQHIAAARFVHVDIDPPKTGGKFDKAVIVSALQALTCQPSFIIDSGGGLQAFWRLDDAYENLSSIEEINRQVRDYFGADACWNIDRLMRVPGFINWPDSKKRARGRVPSLATMAVDDDGVIYSAQEIASAFPPAKPLNSSVSASGERAAIDLPQGWEMHTPASLDITETNPLHTIITGPSGGDRSAEGLACARMMANDGYTDAEIIGILLNAANPIAGHFIDQKDPMRAVRRVIELVRADGPENPAVSHRHIKIDIDEIRRNLEARMAVTQPPVVHHLSPGEGVGEPEWLAALGNGGLAQFVRHVCATAASPQPWVTLGAALATFGAIAGRRYAGPSNLRTNIYSIGIADSGGGKDHPLRSTVRLMVDAGMVDHIGGSKIASGQGLITSVKRSPSVLFPIDEVGFLIAAAADRRRSPKHVTDIMDNLTEFYSLAGGTFLGTAYANDEEKPREVIEQPCLCLFGVTTPSVFWGSLSSGNVLDGSLARMLIFQSEQNYPDPQHDIAWADWPESLTDIAKAISGGAEGHEPFPLGIGATLTPRPYTVPYANAEASAFAREMRDTQTRMLRSHEGTNMTGIIARLAENASKVALIKSITDNPAAPQLGRADLEWGLMVARHSVDALMRAVDERVADNEAEGKLKRVMKVIMDAGAAGISHEELYRRCRFIGGWRQLKEAVQYLKEAEDIVQGEEETGGRKRQVYFANPHA